MSEDDKRPLADRLRDWSRSATPRQRTTPQEMRERLESRREAKDKARAQVSVKDRRAMLRNGLALVIALAAVWTVLALSSATSTFESTSASNAARIAALEGDLLDAQAEAQAAVPAQGEAGATIDKAREAAAAVASLQNDYSPLEVTTGPNGEVLGAEEYKAVNASLRELFTEGARTGGSLDPAIQWFAMWEQDEDGTWVRSPAETYAWEAATAMELSSANSAQLVWLLRDTSTDELLAWAIGTYDSALGGITDVSVTTTSQGDSRVPPSDSGVDGTHEQHEAEPTTETETEDGT